MHMNRTEPILPQQLAAVVMFLRNKAASCLVLDRLILTPQRELLPVPHVKGHHGA